MKKNKDILWIGLGLVSLSVILHYIHYLIFKDAHHTLIFLVADIAFIPMEAFFASLVIDKLLEKREKRHIVEKVRMIVGVFYTEIGTDLLKMFLINDIEKEELEHRIRDNMKWNEEEYKNLNKFLEKRKYDIDIDKVDLCYIKELLDSRKDFLISLITNESIHEHEIFTETLVAILHLREELNTRLSGDIQKYEILHIKKDIERVYKYLVIEWGYYMKYLSENYPYLYVKALITSPFDNRNNEEKDKEYLKTN